MRILHVYKDYHPIMGGIENTVQMLAEDHAAAGHHVTVLVTNPADLPSRETKNGVHIIRAPRLATVASTPLSITFPFQLGGQRPEITHLHFPYPLGEVSQLIFGRNRPYVITYHSDVVKQQAILRLYRPLLHAALRRADRILPTSPAYVQSSPYLRPLADNCTPVPLGIDPTPFMEATPLFPPTDPPTILFMGRHRYYKGADTLIRAMAHLPHGRLILGGDGPMRAEWEQLTADLGLSDRVQFWGNVSAEELPRLYAAADIFCLPSNSRAEAFGIVLMEAMAAARPCVSTELSTGTSFVVQDGETGFVVPPRDPQAMAAALHELVVDPDLRRRMGAAGRERLLQNFTRTRMAERVMGVYGEIVTS